MTRKTRTMAIRADSTNSETESAHARGNWRARGSVIRITSSSPVITRTHLTLMLASHSVTALLLAARFFDPRGASDLATEIIQLRAPDLAAPEHLDTVDTGRIQQEAALDTH